MMAAAGRHEAARGPSRGHKLFVALACGLVLGFNSSVVAAQDGDARTPPPAGLTLTLPETGSSAPAPEGPVFRVGILADAAPDLQRLRLRPFTAHLEALTRRPVELVPFREARGLILGMQRGQIAYAIAPGTLAAATQGLCSCITPLGLQPTTGGGTGLYAAVAVRAGEADTARAGLASLPAERLAIVGEDSVVAHHVGLSELSISGVAVSPGEPYQFLPSLDAAARLLADGGADAVLFWTRQAAGATPDAAEPAHGLSAAQRDALAIVWRSRPVPGTLHYVHADLDADLRSRLAAGLTALDRQNAAAFDALDVGSGLAFIGASLSDLQPQLDALAFWSR